MFNLYFDVCLLIPLGSGQDTLARKRKVNTAISEQEHCYREIREQDMA